ncbi:MAG: hypothetical protein KME64_41175 [Scytonematopsis contorta HA4267-MV1]|nr:hypothetical protein [Scytonematopsis contorta HA4267-MV1]
MPIFSQLVCIRGTAQHYLLGRCHHMPGNLALPTLHFADLAHHLEKELYSEQEQCWLQEKIALLERLCDALAVKQY